MVLSREYPPILRAFVRDAGNRVSVMKDDGVGGTFVMVWRVPIYNFRNGEFCARKSIGFKVERQYYRAYEQSRLVVIYQKRDCCW